MTRDGKMMRIHYEEMEKINREIGILRLSVHLVLLPHLPQVWKKTGQVSGHLPLGFCMIKLS